MDRIDVITINQTYRRINICSFVLDIVFIIKYIKKQSYNYRIINGIKICIEHLGTNKKKYMDIKDILDND